MSTSAAPAMRIVMFVYGDVSHDSRVLREAGTLAAAGHAVTVIARPVEIGATVGDREQRDGFEILRVPVPGGWRRPWRVLGAPVRLALRLLDRLPLGRLGGGAAEETVGWLVVWRYAILGWAKAAAAAAPPADVYHGHDLSGLPAALAARRQHGGTAIYDSHEIFLEAGANVNRPVWIRRRFARLEQRWIRQTSTLISVNEALVQELSRRYEVPRAVAIHNCPPRRHAPSEPDARLVEAIGCPPGTTIALYHGSFAPHRGLEQLAAALLEPGMEAVHAAYLGFGSQRELLDDLVTSGRFGGRLHVLGPVPPDEVVGWVSGSEVAVMALQPSTLNHVLSTPNKLFEALAAGVPVVASDFPGLRSIVVDDPDGPLGEVCDPTDPAAIAAAILRVIDRTPDEAADLRRRCLIAAHERWNWESESAKLLALYDSLRSPTE
jgi:glycosyltransferase involved in cell wall biosynthesis